MSIARALRLSPPFDLALPLATQPAVSTSLPDAMLAAAAARTGNLVRRAAAVQEAAMEEMERWKCLQDWVIESMMRTQRPSLAVIVRDLRRLWMNAVKEEAAAAEDEIEALEEVVGVVRRWMAVAAVQAMAAAVEGARLWAAKAKLERRMAGVVGEEWGDARRLVKMWKFGAAAMAVETERQYEVEVKGKNMLVEAVEDLKNRRLEAEEMKVLVGERVTFVMETMRCADGGGDGTGGEDGDQGDGCWEKLLQESRGRMEALERRNLEMWLSII